jgi:hypothetical protein
MLRKAKRLQITPKDSPKLADGFFERRWFSSEVLLELALPKLFVTRLTLVESLSK